MGCHCLLSSSSGAWLNKWLEVTQSCLTLCDPVDCSLPGSSVHGILQARILEWVAISFSRDLPDPGIKLGSPALQADALLSEPLGKPKQMVYIPTIEYYLAIRWASCVAQSVEHLPTMWETWVQFLGQEIPLEQEMATHSSILDWRIPWTEEPGGYSSWDHKSQT